ncbi:MAG TPA: hypothetical protein VM756_01160 [Burkholderiales bacterium]|nr:hypothetical protein [Burkholderiales bacterium]
MSKRPLLLWKARRDCGHLFRLNYAPAALVLAELVPCPRCIDECEDRMHWLDERADDEERAQRR